MPGTITSLHSAGVKALVSVGGWTGSNLFSTILKNTATRTAFLNNMVSFVQTNNLDGVDIDWEYPGREGNTCNAYDPTNDSKNFLSFLQDLRAKGLAGTMLWSMEMDYNNELLDVLNSFPSGGSTTTATTPGTTSTAIQPGTTSTTKSATTSVPPVTSSTSSAPATSSSTNTGGPVAGGPCSTGGAYQCADTTGKNPAYFICNNGAWLAQSCGSGTACFQSGSSIYCNWPSA
ncbi:hypothetical protein EC988_001149 [Linderina pennispora]|nr:hypothetical protein EC988_001149 [Linderina pennispora]